MRKLLVVFLILLFVLAAPVTVLAIANPGSPPQVSDVFVYEDCLEDGDVGVLIDYYLDYAALPTETATESYLLSFIDTDGTTQLSTVAPYTFTLNALKGYRRGAAWIYFTAAEAAAASLTSASIALYSVWLVGNPTIPSGWPGDPPKTTASLTTWSASADTLDSRILLMAQDLELAWTLDTIEETALGSRLTTTGAAYFTAVIGGVRLIAPDAFAAGTYEPIDEDLDYTTTFGATIEDGTGSIVGSPVTLVEGPNPITATGAGTLILELLKGTEGTVTSGVGGAVIAGSQVTVLGGTNTVTVALAGTNAFIVIVNLVNTQTGIDATVVGTGFDLTALAAMFGVSRMMLSVLVWMGVSVLVVAKLPVPGGSAKMLVFDLMFIGGALLGLMSVLIVALLFIGFGLVVGYVLFYKGASF